MECEQIDLVGFVGSELSALQTSAVADHLQQCGECQDRLRLLLEMRRHRAELLRLKSRSIRRTYVWPVAAAVALAAAMMYWFTIAPRDISRLAVTAPYPLAPPQLRSPRPGDGFLRGAAAYAQNDWVEAERQFRLFLLQHPEDYEASFYLANVLYARKLWDESEALLGALARRNPGDARVQWYLANLALRRGDAGRARRYLETLIESRSEFQGEAISLLRRLPG